MKKTVNTWFPRRLRLALGVLAALLPGLAAALPDDKNQPIHIEADEAVRDERTGLTLYRGNVEIYMGSVATPMGQGYTRY